MHDLIVKESRTKYSKLSGIRSFTCEVRPPRSTKGVSKSRHGQGRKERVGKYQNDVNTTRTRAI